jgi:hypothetical protein
VPLVELPPACLLVLARRCLLTSGKAHSFQQPPPANERVACWFLPGAVCLPVAKRIVFSNRHLLMSASPDLA